MFGSRFTRRKVSFSIPPQFLLFLLLGDFMRGEFLGNYGLHLASGDFDEDGGFDLIVSLRSTPNFLRGDGRGGFADPIELPLPRLQGGTLCRADFNLDGHLDLAYQMQSQVVVALGSGSGSFAQAGSSPALTTRLTVADFNGDGFPDLGGFREQSAILMLGDGAGGFSSLATHPLGLRAWAVASADFDNNGSSDLAVALDESQIAVLYCDEMGRVDETRWIEVPERPEISVGQLAAADFDGDRLPDLVAGNPRSLSVYPGTGTREFAERISLDVCGVSVGTLLADDLDGDCRIDLCFGSGLQLGILLNRSPRDLFAGSVNTRFGDPVDVVFLNGSSGATTDRRVEYGVLERFELRIRRPPAVPPDEEAPFVLYAWRNEPTLESPENLPFGIGCVAMPIPLTSGSPQPDVIWNNASRFRHLGIPTHPSAPAPSILIRRDDGPRRAVRFFVQGLIYDPGSSAEIPASLTNGIVGIPVFGG